MSVRPLSPEELCIRCDPGRFAFQSTAELEPVSARVGQERAVEALRFGMGMRHDGYNFYAMGRPGAGKFTAVRATVQERAAGEPVPRDICYVDDFAASHKPRHMLLPAGKGKELKRDVEQLVEELRTVIPGALETDEFRTRKHTLDEELKGRQESALHELRARASKKGIALVHTPMGFALAPVKDDEVVPPDDFAKLPEADRKRIEEDIQALGEDVRAMLAKVPRWEQEARHKMKELVRGAMRAAVAHLLEDAKKKYAELPEVVAFLVAVEQDVLENASAFMKRDEAAGVAALLEGDEGAQLRRYQVNLLVDHSETKGAPVVFEDSPAYDNLVGRIEHLSRFGALLTDHNLIKPGALHKANGGYLLLDVRNVLLSPYAWEGLKRALLSKQIRIESVGRVLGLGSTVSLEPEPVPLDVKVVVLGERRLFYLLSAFDPEFRALFKVAVDFEDEVDRSDDHDLLYARLVATVVKDEKLRAFDRTGVARVIEHCARLADDAAKLSAHMGKLCDLVREASYWAGERGVELVTAADVERAIDTGVTRVARVRERIYEEIERGTLFVSTTGERVGQVNGLAVLELGGFAFGRPSRITARVRLGRGEVVDIEREVELGGPLHSKGVLILSAFLGARFVQELPLSLAATLVFEQSYGMVEGDSASSAELYALLSALADVPLKQSLAVTGSVNQHGEVQPIGGVNEKIEGFFDVCSARGLSGEQGVVIPKSNVKHLMLRGDVVEAVRAGRFHVYAVESIDEGIEVLSGVPAGARDAAGKFPEGSVNARVEARLEALAQLRLRLGKDKDEDKARGNGDKP
ncbi:MAG: AAA family ATPase [Myxococcales bacterium]|nr:AAA family ATPase [Myxococcales bacterium]